MSQIKKILIANRGEIAIRAMRAANELGKRTVAVYAEEDKLSLHRFKADEAYMIGRNDDGTSLGPVGAYLSIDEILRVASKCGADAVYPGYGLMSENPEFAARCHAAGLIFIGPNEQAMRRLGDKASARREAMAIGVPVIPATNILNEDIEQAKREALEIGYPLMLKASHGGGGRGMRRIHSEDELIKLLPEAKREAESFFGSGDVYLEKLMLKVRHVEVQILGDNGGNIYHLWERDCTVQRRNQKVVERAPAPYLVDAQRQVLCNYAVRLCESVGYDCAGTCEFLMDMSSGEFFFIEVNPRIQVEHTVTEEVTGIDIVRAQILLSEGKTLVEATGIASQDQVKINGHALQCRITTEDPDNGFIPDYGRITAYRGANGMGVRLDGGTAYSGAIITRYYDSLLEKVTVWAPTPRDAIARMDRALREFRIRGVSTNIMFVENLLKHPVFRDNSYWTTFIDDSPELFQFAKRKDRASKILHYLAHVIVNGNPDVAGRPVPASPTMPISVPKLITHERPEGTKNLLARHGPDGVVKWLNAQPQVLFTDTTMRDGHQSLLATRMRSADMIRIADAYSHNLPMLFSMECWGGATFDVAYRYLRECPWKRLRDLRAAMPNILTQMLLRGSNCVGYTNYADNVVKRFIKQASTSGVDVFRVFDSLNWIENMRVAIDAVLEEGALCEGTICYTGDLQDVNRSKYDLKYYLEMARGLQNAGVHILAIKDMAGVMKPEAARVLISSLKQEFGMPIHFHTHDTSGMSGATVLAACDAGADIVDAAMDAISGGTSQPCFGSLVECLKNGPRDSQIDVERVREISRYWEGVRERYAAFEDGMSAPNSEVYLHAMPGGQFTNLQAQARSMGLMAKWPEIARAYSDVNEIFGDIVKVTPSSKVVGDMALMMVSQGIDRAAVEDPDVEVAFPESVVEMMAGELGRPVDGFPPAIVAKILKGREPIELRPGAYRDDVDFEAERIRFQDELETQDLDDEDLLSCLLYPAVFADYHRFHNDFGPVRALPTHDFFYPMKPGEEIEAEIDPGKRLEIRLQAVAEPNERGEVKAFFELNGQPRVVRLVDKKTQSGLEVRAKADPSDADEIGAPMPGLIVSVAVVEGSEVMQGDAVAIIEAMKMETVIRAERDAVVGRILTKSGDVVEAKDLLFVLREQDREQGRERGREQGREQG